MLASPVRPSIVLSVDTMASGDVVFELVMMAKNWSYDNKGTGRQPRIIIDLSGSTAAATAGLNPALHRFIAINVGPFGREEAVSFVTPQIPKVLQDRRRREQIARYNVAKFDLTPTLLIAMSNELHRHFRGRTGLQKGC
mmetsp:Transcript_52385/g.126785  ORF Transcript_52385/g.126785 Transcript_52385/m.126785 type:complete len:139 (-) Transcript_52385:1538-1954(-)